MIRVIIVDDHRIVRAGVRRILEKDSNIAVLAEAANGEEARLLARTYGPDIVLMDVGMPRMGGIEALQALRRDNPGLKVIGLSMYIEGTLPAQFLAAGGAGYLSKDGSEAEMLAAIKQVNSGTPYVSAEVACNIVVNASGSSPVDQLSRRELQVLRAICMGLELADIAEQLSISPKTVRTYRARVLRKLRVKNNVQLTLLARSCGLVEVPDASFTAS